MQWVETFKDYRMCPYIRECYVQASMELGPEDVSLLERCPHFRGCYVQASMELEPEDVSLLYRVHFRECYALIIFSGHTIISTATYHK